jgi:hypothetical protein
MMDVNQMAEVIESVYCEQGQSICDAIYNSKYKAHELAEGLNKVLNFENNGGFMCYVGYYEVTKDEIIAVI